MSVLTAPRASRNARVTATAAATALAASALTLLPATTARAVDPVPAAVGKPPVIVSMGDSFISGEAGRWQGNSLAGGSGHDGTDRAWNAERRKSDPELVYGTTYESGCHRSDSAEIKSAPVEIDGAELPKEQRINLACAGATSEAVLLPGDGGKPFKGERSQAEQLADVAEKNDVRLIVLSLGGNDLGFSGIIADCVTQFVKPVRGRPCSDTVGGSVAERLPKMRAAVGRAVDSIRTAMNGANRPRSSYRLVLQSYPSPVPGSAEVRYPKETYDRLGKGGCPFFDKDLTWAHDRLIPDISDSIARVAADKGAEFLDLSRAFDGRETCAKASHQVTPDRPASGETSEWMRFLTVGTGQGQVQESLHPNHFGQQALGSCLSRVFTAAAGQHRCTNTTGRGPQDMALRSTTGT